MMLQASCPSAASREVLHDWHGSPGGSKGSCDPSTRSYHTCSRPASAEMTLTKNDDERNGREKSRVSPWGPRAPGEGRDRDGVGRAGAWRPRAGGGWGGATSGSSEDPGVSGEQLRRTGLPKTPGAVDSGLGRVSGYRGLRHRDLGGRVLVTVLSPHRQAQDWTQARRWLGARRLARPLQSPVGHTATRSRLLCWRWVRARFRPL